MTKEFNHIDKAIEFIRNASAKAIKEVAMKVESSAVLYVSPSGNGKLKQSIDHKIIEDGSEVVGIVGTNQEYAVFVEFGTGEFAKNGDGRKGGWVYKASDGNFYFTYGQKPKPFLEPAFKDNIDEIKQAVQSNFKG